MRTITGADLAMSYCTKHLFLPATRPTRRRRRNPVRWIHASLVTLAAFLTASR